MNILVVGGAGYIGSHAVYELLRDGNNVVVLDNLSTGDKSFVPENVKLYVGDIRKSSDIDNVFINEKIDLVMHFAAKIVVPESVEFPLEYYHNNVEGVRLLLDSMVRHGVKNIVFSSTAAVYGEPSEGVCYEDDYKLPINPYGESKLACERLIHWTSNAHDLNYVIFRYFNVAGADDSLEIGLKKDLVTHLIPVAIQAALGIRKELKIFGDDYKTNDGTAVRDYIHVTDLAKAHVLGAKYLINGGKSDVFNLGSNSGYSVLEVVNAANEITKIPYSFDERRAGDPAMLIANIDKATKTLNWKPLKSLKEMIESDLAYRKKISGKE